MTEQNQASSLDLSDDDFLNMNAEEFLADVSEEPVEDSVSEVNNTPLEANDEDEESLDSEAQEQPELDDDNEEVSQLEEDIPQEHEPELEDSEPESLDTSNSSEQDTEGDTPETEAFDYESAYRKVMSPFKANGTTMSVDNPEDAIRLMQMGANYQKKMKQLKPNLRMIKMLENNGLLDEGKINNLIDLAKKEPAAIAKLLKESGLDPLDIDTNEDVAYTPKNYSVSDKEIALDQALEDIRGNDSYGRTLAIMSKQWDNESKQIVSDNPELIGIIDSHVQNGVYDTIEQFVQREQALGRLTGIPDIVAYKQAADHLSSTGQLVKDAEPAKEKQATQQVSGDRKAKSDAKLKQKRKAAASTKRTNTSTEAPVDDFLNLSDEEFMKKFA